MLTTYNVLTIFNTPDFEYILYVMKKFFDMDVKCGRWRKKMSRNYSSSVGDEIRTPRPKEYERTERYKIR